MDSFHGEHGQPLTFSYLPEFGRLAYIAIPDPRKDPKADADAMRGFRQWFWNRSRYGFESAIWGCIRTVCDVAGSPHDRGPKGDWNGDKLGEGIVAVLDAFTTSDGGPYDPSSDDGMEFVDPDFWAPIASQKRGKTFDRVEYEKAEAEHAQRARKSKSHYFRRYAKRFAGRRIRSHEKQQQPSSKVGEKNFRCEQLVDDLDSEVVFDHIRFRRRDGRHGLWCSFDWQEPWQQLENEDNSRLDDCKSWLSQWLSEHVTDPVKRRIMDFKIADPNRTQQQIIDLVNRELGTKYTYEKVRHTLLEVEETFRASREEYDFRFTKAKKRDRAGKKRANPPNHGAHCHLAIGRLEAAAQFDLDGDGWKNRSEDGRIVRRHAA